MRWTKGTGTGVSRDEGGQLRDDVPFWRKGERIGNFGDLLSEYLLRRALTGEARGDCVDAAVVRVVGSVVSDWTVDTDVEDPEGIRTRLFWGCGLREAAPLRADLMGRCRFPAVRGPYTRDALGLGPGVPLGDPGLLLPLLRGGRVGARRGGATLVPHVLDPRPRGPMMAATGCGRCLESGVEPTMAAVEAFVDAVTGSDFVLTASLHGAVTACAYGVPYAYWSAGGLVDAPFKWHDFAASVGVPAAFCATAAEGAAHHAAAPPPRLPSMARLLAAAPFAPAPGLMARAEAFDADPLGAAFGPMPDDRRHMTGKGGAGKQEGETGGDEERRAGEAPDVLGGRRSWRDRLAAYAGR